MGGGWLGVVGVGGRWGGGWGGRWVSRVLDSETMAGICSVAVCNDVLLLINYAEAPIHQPADTTPSMRRGLSITYSPAANRQRQRRVGSSRGRWNSNGVPGARHGRATETPGEPTLGKDTRHVAKVT